jgi:thioredoxin 2
MNSAELDDRGLVVRCLKCGQRNRLPYDRLEQTPRCRKCGDQLQVPGEPIDIQNDQTFDALTSRCTLPVLVDFWAPWCGPCKMVAPELNKIAGEGMGQWLVAKVNTENLQNLARRFRINAIPTMVLFNNGIEVARQVGAMAAPAIRKFLQPWIRAR